MIYLLRKDVAKYLSVEGREIPAIRSCSPDMVPTLMIGRERHARPFETSEKTAFHLCAAIYAGLAEMKKTL
jgi:hypothetical protein